MELTAQEVAARTEARFEQCYPYFKAFQTEAEYRPYWDLCMEAVRDRDVLVPIVFVNDYFGTPPVRTFLARYGKEVGAILEARGETVLDPFTKKSMGAFWGTVFKFVLGYGDRGTATMVKNRCFGLRSASFFYRQAEPVKIVEGERG